MIKVINTETPGGIWNHRYLSRLQKSKFGSIFFFQVNIKGYSEKNMQPVNTKRYVNFLPGLPIFEDGLQSLVHSRHSINAC